MLNMAFYSTLCKIYLKEWKLKTSHVNFPNLMAQNWPSNGRHRTEPRYKEIFQT